MNSVREMLLGEIMDVDLLVLGAGMAGLTAGAVAARGGARVVVVERATQIGGSAALSGGYFWTARSLDALHAENPDGDVALGEVLLNTYADVLEWVRSTGVWVSEQVDVLHGIGHRIDIVPYLQRCRAIVESADGWVLPGRETQRLIVEDGAVRGAVIRGPEGEDEEVRAGHTLLATGGFQASHELLREHLGDAADDVLLRSNPYSDGAGLRFGRSCNAAERGHADRFYGHLISTPLEAFEPEDFVRLAMIFSEESLLLNLAGNRFTDESLGDHYSAQAVARQPEGRALLVFDKPIREGSVRRPVVSNHEEIDNLQEATMSGSHTAQANTVEELAEAAAVWGYDRDGVTRSIREFNQALHDEMPLEPSRVSQRRPLEMGPWYAIEVCAGVTFTHHGLRIDEDARVLRGDGPVPGLLAAGADTGGIFDGGYAGGLNLAGCFGYRAAQTALRDAQPAS